jgi:plasmid stabilization system protein ParE
MRRVILAPSFDVELLNISIHIARSFGLRSADEFEDRVIHTTAALAFVPSLGKTNHGYPTPLYSFVLGPNRIFYRFTEGEIHFLHIRSGRMEKDGQRFTI